MNYIAKVIVGIIFFSVSVEHGQSLVNLSAVRANRIELESSDGKILVVGSATINGMNQGFLARYTAAGALDTTFNGTGVVTASVGDNTVFNDVTQQTDGKLVVVGYANFMPNTLFLSQSPQSLEMSPQFIAMRYNSDGSLDTSFGNQGVATNFILSLTWTAGYSVVQLANGQLLMTGSTEQANYIYAFTCRLNSDGSLDTSFASGGYTIAGQAGFGTHIIIQPSNQYIVISGPTAGYFYIYRYTPTGAADTSFGYDQGTAGATMGGTVQVNNGIVMQSDGSFVVGGSNDYDFALMRFTPTGSLDSTYGNSGRVNTAFAQPARIQSLILQSDGYVVAVGNMAGQIVLARYTTTGALDTTYGTNGQIVTNIGSPTSPMYITWAIQQPNDGKILVCGYSGINSFMTRFNTDGSQDTTFGLVSALETCSTALCAYGQVYNQSQIDVLSGQLFTFDTNGMLNGISHSTTTNPQNVVIEQAGTYLVNYFIEASAPAVLQLLQNGVAVPAASFTSQGSAISVGRAIITAQAGDTLSLINQTSYDVYLVGGGGINASIDIERIA